MKSMRNILNSDISQNSILPINTVKPDVSIDGINNTETESKQNELLIDDSTLDLIKKRNSQNIRQKINISNENEKKMDSYFGYNVFQGNPELFQASSFEPVGPDYIVGPGDEIIIMLWGETEINSSYTITRDGYVFLPNVGQVFVNGLTLEGLEKKLFKLLKKAYSSLDPSSGLPTTFFSVSLGSITLKPIRIFILGEIDQPGAYSVKPSASLFSSLFYFNGPKTSGSLREIKLIRNGKQFATIDYYDYLTKGTADGDIRLQRNDVIFIPPRKNTITLSV